MLTNQSVGKSISNHKAFFVGDVRVCRIAQLQVQDTSISGTITDVFARSLVALKVFEAANTNLAVQMEQNEFSKTALPFPKLMRLDLSGCPLMMNASELFAPFSFHENFRELRAVNSSIMGPVPQLLWRYGIRVDGTLFSQMGQPLGNSLVKIDLSHNQLTQVLAHPDGVGSLLSLNLQGNGLRLGVSDILLQADGLLLDLRETSVHREDLFDATSAGWHRGDSLALETSRFKCYGIAGHRLVDVTPITFAPQALCSCRPGYFGGNGINCTICKAGTYSSKVIRILPRQYTEKYSYIK